MDIRLAIDTEDRQLAFSLMDSTRVGSGTAISIPGGATLTMGTMQFRKAFGIPETLELVLTFGTGVVSGVVANWIYGKLKGRNVTLRIEEMDVEVDEGKITRAISRIIEKKE